MLHAARPRGFRGLHHRGIFFGLHHGGGGTVVALLVLALVVVAVVMALRNRR